MDISMSIGGMLFMHEINKFYLLSVHRHPVFAELEMDPSLETFKKKSETSLPPKIENYRIQMYLEGVRLNFK